MREFFLFSTRREKTQPCLWRMALARFSLSEKARVLSRLRLPRARESRRARSGESFEGHDGQRTWRAKAGGADEMSSPSSSSSPERKRISADKARGRFVSLFSVDALLGFLLVTKRTSTSLVAAVFSPPETRDRSSQENASNNGERKLGSEPHDGRRGR